MKASQKNITNVFNAIRNDSKIGRNTDSVVDMTMTDTELKQEIAEKIGEFKSTQSYLRWMKKHNSDAETMFFSEGAYGF